MKKIGIIINPRAKKIRKMKNDVDAVFKNIAGDYAEIRLTRDIKDIDIFLDEFKKMGVDYIGVAGGDGTLHHVLTGLLTKYDHHSVPPILILKGGTMDNVSRTISLEGWGPDILKRLIYRLQNGSDIKTFLRGTIRINDRYCFLFGSGFVTNFLELAYKGEKGFLKNVQVAFEAVYHALFKDETSQDYIYKGFSADIYVDDNLIELKYVRSLLGGTVEYIAPGMCPLYDASRKPDKFHVLLSGMPPKSFVLNLYKILRGRRIVRWDHYDSVVKNIKIISRDKFEYTMDGDLYYCDGSLEAACGPQIELIYV